MLIMFDYKKLRNYFKSHLNTLLLTFVLGIAMLSIGIYLSGIHFPNGNYVLIAGSFLIYISIIFFAIKV